MDPLFKTSLISALVGAVGAVVTWLFTRGRIRAEVDKTMGEADQAEAEAAVARQKVADSQVSTAMSLMEALRTRIVELTASLAALNVSHASVVSEFTARIVACEKGRAEIKELSDSLHLDLEKANGRIDHLEEKVERLEREKDALHRDLERIESQAVPPAKP